VTAPDPRDPFDVPDDLAALLDDVLSGPTPPDRGTGWSRQAIDLLTAARGPADPDELAGEATVVAAMAEAIGREAERTAVRRRRGRVVRRVLAAKTGAVVVLALGVTAAAAATGVAVTIVAPDVAPGPPRDDRPPVTSAPVDADGNGRGGGEPAGPGPFCQAAEALCPTAEPAPPPATPDPHDTGHGPPPERDPDGKADKQAKHEDKGSTSKADPGPPPGHGPPAGKGPPEGKGPGSSQANGHASAKHP
jgi:hypothetical protein